MSALVWMESSSSSDIKTQGKKQESLSTSAFITTP